MYQNMRLKFPQIRMTLGFSNKKSVSPWVCCWHRSMFSNVKIQRKVVSLFRDFLEGSPPYLPDCLQNAITFFLFGLCWVWKSMLDKSIHIVCFSKKKLSLSVSHHFLLSFFKKLSPFCQKMRILAGNRQTTKTNFKWKVWMF